MGKFFGIILGMLLVVLFVLLSWQINPQKTAVFLPTAVQKLLSGETFLQPAKETTSPSPSSSVTKKETPSLEELPEQKLEELSDVTALLVRGENFFQAGAISLAINDFSRATELAPQTRQTWKKLVEAQISSRDFSAAGVSLQKALSFFPNDREFLVLLGEVQLQQSKFIDAEQTFSRLSEGGEKSFYLGVMAAHAQQFQKAKQFFTAAKSAGFAQKAQLFLDDFAQYELFPEGDPLYLRLLLAKTFDDLRFFELAIDSAKSILKQRGDYRDAWIILGHSYLSLDRFDLAKNVLDQAMKLDPTKPETAFFLAMAEAAMGNYNDAIGHFLIARENGYSPQSEVIAALADAYAKGGFYESARKEYEKLTEVRTASVEDYEKPIRISLLYLKDTDTAKRLATKAVEMHPDSLDAKHLLVWAFLEANELQKARLLLEEVLARDTKNPQSHIYMGDLLAKEGKVAEALESYKTAYDLSPHTETGIKAAQKYNTLLLENQ